MRYLALACDYDGTIAEHGVVAETTEKALDRLRASGRRLVLVTGRELDDLLAVFGEIELFDRVVAENGAVLYDPAGKHERRLGKPPPDPFVAALRERGVSPVSVGRVIVATWEPNETIVLEVIRELGLELHVVFNKGAVMVLPPNVNKATGLHAALREMGLSAHNVVGVGDAENDHAFLQLCEYSVAVANALETVKDRCDLVTAGARGAGVEELIGLIVEDDLAGAPPGRRRIVVGERPDGTPETIEPYGSGVLVAGPSGSGKSTIVTAVLEALADHGYQFCVVDPEGDYSSLEGVVVLGGADREPSPDEVMGVLADPTSSLVVNMLGVRLDDRPAFFDALLSRLAELQGRSGRPHWLVLDEAHHLVPSMRESGTPALLQHAGAFLLVTVHPERVAGEALDVVDVVVGVGDAPQETLDAFAEASGAPAPGAGSAGDGRVLLWRIDDEPVAVRVAAPEAERRRHVRKYAEGELGADRSFYFRGRTTGSTCARRTSRSSRRWPRASTTTPGSTTGARTITRDGSAR